MRPTSPRIHPLAPHGYTDEQSSVVGGREASINTLNLTRTLVQHPSLFRSWMPFAEYMGLRSILPARDREIFVLRIISLCDSAYETSHHLFIAQKIGLTREEIVAAQEGDATLSSFEQVLVRAADELVRDHCISDPTWGSLAERYTPRQLIELVYTGGMYMVLSVVTNSLGIQPEENVEQAWKP